MSPGSPGSDPGSEVTRLDAEDRGRLLGQILAKERWRLEKFAIRAVGRKRADGEDVFQQACLQFCRAYPGGSNPLGWLFVVIRHEASHLHRARRSRGESSIESTLKRPDEVNSKQVQEWLGHSDPAFTLSTYVHLMDDGLGGADFFDQAVKPKPRKHTAPRPTKRRRR